MLCVASRTHNNAQQKSAPFNGTDRWHTHCNGPNLTPPGLRNPQGSWNNTRSLLLAKTQQPTQQQPVHRSHDLLDYRPRSDLQRWQPQGDEPPGAEEVHRSGAQGHELPPTPPPLGSQDWLREGYPQAGQEPLPPGAGCQEGDGEEGRESREGQARGQKTEEEGGTQAGGRRQEACGQEAKGKEGGEERDQDQSQRKETSRKGQACEEACEEGLSSGSSGSKCPPFRAGYPHVDIV
mmetsp:Transcript_4316/g.13226  ORF Transcript_4316/g.13226 Transcript_4316/m.13226 type:complete len:236 (-) Transcript_4316:27-734(-)